MTNDQIADTLVHGGSTVGLTNASCGANLGVSKFFKTDGSNGSTTIWMYLMSLNYTLKNG